MKTVGIISNTLSATLSKELTVFTRYLPNMIGTVLQLGLRLVFFLFFSGVASYSGVLRGKGLFLFFGAALLLYIFYSTSIWAPLNAVTNDLYNGTLEYLYITPSSKFSYYFGTGISSIILNMIFFIPMFIFICLYSRIGLWQEAALLLSIAVGILNCISIGVLISLLGIIWKQVGSITGILSVLFEFLAGAYAPVQSYPYAIRCMAYSLPFTWGYDLARHYLLGNVWEPLAPPALEWFIYVSMAAGYTAIAYVLMAKIQTRVTKSGLSGI